MFKEINEWLFPVLLPLFDHENWRNSGNKKLKIWKNEMRQIITDPAFRDTLSKALQVLTPIDRNLNLCQSDNLHLSDVYQQWKRLPNELNALRLPDEHKNFIISKVNSRWEFLKSKCHIISYYLDPRPDESTRKN